MSKALACTALALAMAACSSAASAPSSELASPEPAPTEETTDDAAPAGLHGIFSETQATRGEDLFDGVCGECHFTNEFRDSQFQFSWRRRTVADLFGHISDTMPENAPGSLTPEQYADVVAYILSLNGVQAGGADLPSDLEVLEAYSLSALSGS